MCCFDGILVEPEGTEKVLVNEQDKFEQLVQDAENWKRTTLIRGYINALEESIKKGETMSSEQSDYVQWARKKIALLDPLEKVGCPNC